ncbi:MAG TPA: hypothetical protein VHS06_09855 [Chloroflexota bacterium]|nr:hypothetical protein [Chloroflexota bacterium]
MRKFMMRTAPATPGTQVGKVWRQEGSSGLQAGWGVAVGRAPLEGHASGVTALGHLRPRVQARPGLMDGGSTIGPEGWLWWARRVDVLAGWAWPERFAAGDRLGWYTVMKWRYLASYPLTPFSSATRKVGSWDGILYG